MAILKTQHLRFLVAVVEYGGVIRAAQRLHLSQPSISSGLKALEAQLGGALFDRRGPANRPLRLTPAGQRFYRRALEILNECETALTEFSGQPVSETRVRLGVLDTLPQSLVANVIRQLEVNEPEMRLELWEGSANRLASWFTRNRLAVVWGNVGDLTPHARVLWREPLVAVMAPNHALATSMGTIPIRDLAKAPFVHRSNCELDSLGRARLKAAQVKLDVRFRAEREDLAFQWVRNGMGITLAPRSLVPPDLAMVEVSGLDIERTIGLQWREDIPAQVPAALSSAVALVADAQ
ncbi:MAG: LysR family transcriptional regulator [Pseudomonadota bacterium]